MSAESTKAAILKEMPHLTEDVLKQIRSGWGRDNPMRQIINVIARQRVENARTALETCTPDKLPAIQGAIVGVRDLLNAINAEGSG